nr:hypothetical protein [Brevibacterium sp. CFH 10365]
MTDQAVAEAATPSITVPPMTTRWAPNRAMSAAGRAEDSSDPTAKQATTRPNCHELSPSRSTSSGYHGRRAAKTAPLPVK